MLDLDTPVFVFSGDADTKLSSSFLHTEFVKYFPKANFEEVVTAGHLIPVENLKS